MAAIGASLTLLLATSLIPGLMFYAVPLTMTGTFLALAMLLYIALAAVGRGLIAWRQGRAASLGPAGPDLAATFGRTPRAAVGAVAVTVAIAAWMTAVMWYVSPGRLGIEDTTTIDGSLPPALPQTVTLRSAGGNIEARKYAWPETTTFDHTIWCSPTA